ncbi:ATP-binding protein [Actinacidiphila rubida]|uniref:Histidine kinase-like ATPase domain-containing protein n=1 Tax=Actinacidiphila rubida TaxID=310780 RepID=A0A1H8P1B2_9ACTN|nr:ATP-binding protein [Actinacidiphila rubida]SEO35551.1 Histidine kinase-like ATPase domain-containing protein [Actinacidiphila rubida]
MPAALVVLDDLSLAVEREQLTQAGEVRRTTARWVGRLRQITAVKLNLWGLSVLADDAQLLVSELVTNGFRHGSGAHIVFRLVIRPDAVVVEVDDGSPSRPEVCDPGPDSVRGRGLVLVSALASSWGVSPDGTRTWCVLKPPGATREEV